MIKNFLIFDAGHVDALHIKKLDSSKWLAPRIVNLKLQMTSFTDKKNL